MPGSAKPLSPISVETESGEVVSVAWEPISQKLRTLVKQYAKQLLGEKYRPNATPNETILMGGGPGAYDFTVPEARSFARDVVKAVNEEKKTKFTLTIEIKISWTFGEFMDALWADLLDQMKESATILIDMGGSL